MQVQAAGVTNRIGSATIPLAWKIKHLWFHIRNALFRKQKAPSLIAHRVIPGKQTLGVWVDNSSMSTYHNNINIKDTATKGNTIGQLRFK